jgi:hypothetical protein
VLAFCCWRSLQENELDHLPLSAAGFQSTVDEGPFSFADGEQTRRTLEAAGFSEIIIQSHNEEVSSGDLDAMTWVLLKVGPLGKFIRENPALRATAEFRLREGPGCLGRPLQSAALGFYLDRDCTNGSRVAYTPNFHYTFGSFALSA